MDPHMKRCAARPVHALENLLEGSIRSRAGPERYQLAANSQNRFAGGYPGGVPAAVSSTGPGRCHLAWLRYTLALLLRVAPPRPRNLTPVSVRIRWTKP